MRRRFAYILLALYLFSTTEAYQLLKVPLLAMHFIQHCKEDPDLSLLAFLEMHYAGETVYDDDWQQDMQLPFKTCSYAELSISTGFRSESVILQCPPVSIIIPNYRPHTSGMHGITHHASIFQPPRLISA